MLARLDRALLVANRWTVIAMLAAMAAIVFANVALRFTTGVSILWVEEVSRYLMIWLSFLGAGMVLRYGGHVGIDTLQEALPRRAVAIRGAIVALLAAFFVFMAAVGARYAWLAWGQTTPVLGIPVGAVYLAIPIGFALLLAHLLLMAQGYVRQRRLLADGEFDADAAKM
ncbi:MAG TPA: TRAP transporter small permease [Casimicrobiaceae bacterium]|nr:TRAP transporter small permease [Casimicrobiaceae bacterium]